MNRRIVRTLILAMLLPIASCRRGRMRQPVAVLTTPAVAATELPQHLAAEFTKESGVKLDIRVITREQIVAAARAQSGAIAIFRDPDLEHALARDGGTRLRGIFAYEDFVLLGPSRDPAHVAGAPTAAEAFRRIAVRRRLFCSAADVAVIGDAEHEVWSAAHIDPATNRRYRKIHGDAADVLETAAKLGAYTLTDRATADAHPSSLNLLLRDVPQLHFNYEVALLRSAETRTDRNAAWFVEWLMSYRGREGVRNFRGPLPRLYLPGEHR